MSAPWKSNLADGEVYTCSDLIASRAILLVGAWTEEEDGTLAPPETLVNLGVVSNVEVGVTGQTTTEKTGMPIKGPICTAKEGGYVSITGTIATVTDESIAFALGNITPTSGLSISDATINGFYMIQVVYIDPTHSNDLTDLTEDDIRVFSMAKVQMNAEAYKTAHSYGSLVTVPFEGSSYTYLGSGETDPLTSHVGYMLLDVTVPTATYDLTAYELSPILPAEAEPGGGT